MPCGRYFLLARADCECSHRCQALDYGCRETGNCWQQGTGVVFVLKMLHSIIYKNHDSSAAGGYLQASITRAAAGFYALRQQCIKDGDSCHESAPAKRKSHDKLACGNTHEAEGSFLYLKNHKPIKKCLTAWPWLLPRLGRRIPYNLFCFN